MILNVSEFNKKWKDHLEQGHYGLAINDLKVIQYLDSEFTKFKETVPNFTYSQIKLKFNTARVYMQPYNLIDIVTMENKINSIINGST